MTDIIDLIPSIPMLLQYFVPGYLFLSIARFLGSWKISDTTVTIWSIIISYIYSVAITAINAVLPAQITMNTWECLVAQLLAAVGGAVVMVYIHRSKILSKLLRKINHKSVHSNLWDDMIDYDIGTTVVIKLHGTNNAYCGTITAIEENGLDSWIALTEYLMLDWYSHEEIPTPEGPSCIKRLMLSFRDIESVELYYNKDTKIFS